MSKFEQHGRLSVLYRRKEKFLISYCRWDPNDRYRSNTTALVFNKVDLFLLHGDHREGYEKCNSLSECIDYFLDHIDLVHVTSNHLNVCRLDWSGKYRQDTWGAYEFTRDILGVENVSKMVDKLKGTTFRPMSLSENPCILRYL